MMSLLRCPNWQCLLACTCLLFMLGCSSGQASSTASGAPAAKEALADLANLLKHCAEEKKPPPATLADIQPIEPLFQAAYLGLIRGDIVYVWGAPLNPAGIDKVLAYEKAAESGPGWVLMQDGTVKSLTAEEFKAAAKATK